MKTSKQITLSETAAAAVTSLCQRNLKHSRTRLVFWKQEVL